MKTLKENGEDFINLITSIEGINHTRYLYLIGYSLGGLIIRYALRNSPTIRHLTTGVLTVNTPHKGTPLVSLPFAPPEFWEYLHLINSGKDVSKKIALFKS